MRLRTVGLLSCGLLWLVVEACDRCMLLKRGSKCLVRSSTCPIAALPCALYHRDGVTHRQRLALCLYSTSSPAPAPPPPPNLCSHLSSVCFCLAALQFPKRRLIKSHLSTPCQSGLVIPLMQIELLSTAIFHTVLFVIEICHLQSNRMLLFGGFLVSFNTVVRLCVIISTSPSIS